MQGTYLDEVGGRPLAQRVHRPSLAGTALLLLRRPLRRRGPVEQLRQPPRPSEHRVDAAVSPGVLLHPRHEVTQPRKRHVKLVQHTFGGLQRHPGVGGDQRGPRPVEIRVTHLFHPLAFACRDGCQGQATPTTRELLEDVVATVEGGTEVRVLRQMREDAEFDLTVVGGDEDVAGGRDDPTT